MSRKLVLLTAALFAATLWGCGSNRDGGDTAVTPDDGTATAQVVGIENCAQCHAKYNEAWLAGTHGNANARPGGGDPHDPTSSCGRCHNQLGQAVAMPNAFPGEGIRDVVVCESCHGGGSNHRGLGPIPVARPDWEQCVACHDHAEGVRHAADYGMLASNVGASAHNNADNLHASSAKCQRCHSVEGSIRLANFTGDKNVMALMEELEPIDLEENMHPVTCSACHVPHSDVLRADTAIQLDYVLNEDTAEEQEVTGAWDPNANGVADQFDFCTSCHTYYNQDGVLVGSGSEASGTAPFYHNTAWYRTLPTTHYDNPATSVAAGGDKTVEGYVIRQNSANPCFDCHGHELRTNTRRSRSVAGPDDNAADYGSTIHTQWASSAHAGGLLKAKYAAADGTETGAAEVDAVMAAGAIDAAVGNAWTHYSWDATYKADGVTKDRADCQHCHTATGAANFLNAAKAGTAYDVTGNDFSHLAGWNAAGGSDQNELLYCWGCHSNPQTGTLRATGAIPLDYQVDGVAASLTAPDGNSGVCLSCHSGRGNVNSLLMVDTADADFINENPAATTGYKAGGTSTHYLTAGATINQEQTRVGYTFGLLAADPANYADPSYYAHNTLGCAECHMTSGESHTFAVVEKDEAGVVTRVASTKCVECHDGGHGAALVSVDGPLGTAAAAAALLEEEAEGYHQALEILAEEIAATGTIPVSSHPYFIMDANGDGVITDADRTVDGNANGTVGEAADKYETLTPDNEGHSGAMHNYSLLHHEPGAYAHNRLYAKRLIYDSLDWLDNAAMDKSVVIDAATYPHAAAWLGSTRP